MLLTSGMIVGTLFTLFVVPSIYVLLARRRSLVSEARRSGRVPELAAAVSIALAVGITASPASAQTTTLRLTIDEAVRRAVENNPDLAIVRLDTEVEAARVGETRTAHTPVFSRGPGRMSIRKHTRGQMLRAR